MSAARIGPDDRVTIAANVHARELHHELVILDLANGDYWALDELGSRVWQGLSRGQSIREVAQGLEGAYAVDLATLLRDLLALADELVQRKLVVPRPASAGSALGGSGGGPSGAAT